MLIRPSIAHCQLLWGVILILMIAGISTFHSCSKPTTVDDEETDRTPPTATTDLLVTSFTSQTVTLRWTTPADTRDDGSGGAVNGYDLRMSSDSITAANFASAVTLPVPGPLPAGQVQSWSISGLAPGQTHCFALKAQDDKGNWSGLSNCVSAQCPAIEIVLFADPVIEQVIRLILSKPVGDIVSSEVDTIRQLTAINAGVSSLAGLEHLTSLQVTTLISNNITDLSPLGGLTQLAGLYVSDNQIGSVAPLTGMISLRQLHLSDNPISDISPLATTDSLQQLILWGTPVTDFTPLYGLYHLSDVGFDRMNLSNIEFMSHLKRPTICGLGFNQITSVEPLWSKTSIEALNLMQNQLTDISALSSLTNLRELKLTNNQIVDLTPLSHNTGLGPGDVVYVGGNPLSQYSLDTLIPSLRFRGVTVITDVP